MTDWKNAITDVPGIVVGHAQDDEAKTGVTVVLAAGGAVAAVDVRGGAPDAIGTDTLQPGNLVEKAHAIVLTGGSAFGLASVTGVRQWLEEHGEGFDTQVAKVPIVGGAVLFDLGVGRADVRPDAAMGYAACVAASADEARVGAVGAGTGATVGKLMGPQLASAGGVGTASIDVGGGLVVGALFAVNALGEVVDPATGQIVAGIRNPAGGEPAFFETLGVMKQMAGMRAGGGNTVIGVVATNATLDRAMALRVAHMAHDGLARAVRPAHTLYDGDVIFVLCTGQVAADVNVVGAFAAEAVSAAIIRAVK